MDKVNDKISCIIPIYNAEKYLERCVESILVQSYSNIEVILINDGSSDKSLKICKKYALLDKRVKYFSFENQGVCCARNHGLENATGDFILFVDADDYLDEKYIEKLHNNMDYDIEIVFSQLNLMEDNQYFEKEKK